jgi:hypothetical protein
MAVRYEAFEGELAEEPIGAHPSRLPTRIPIPVMADVSEFTSQEFITWVLVVRASHGGLSETSHLSIHFF